ncbi:F-box protein At2g32560-like [Dioscorea cayenensis subsp. rotundata]|uniref:F-box protein At2g32560-like n=1 Tax=Dioscorea cayennensis subsp. rotundata TaxID=55577 RepID=A0AB40B7A5_DIOCR|nr:F-box protein At2g32560-like [Dioscorea cayenensis subsp. rotundata]
MFFLLLSSLPFIFLLSKSLPLKQTHWLDLVPSLNLSIKMSSKRRSQSEGENEGENDMFPSVLDLPELALDMVLGKLSPAGLSSMSCVCKSLRETCRSDHMWEKHMKAKWGRLIGKAAQRQWDLCMALRNQSLCKAKGKGFFARLSCVLPLHWIKSRIDGGAKSKGVFFPDVSIMSWYLSLENGKFWFPAQVYNREHGHVGFMLSCYDAEVSYDCHTDTFRARYPPHGRRTVVIEEGVQWERLRASPVETSAHELHISDCLHELLPGDHIEIQWRRNKEFPYGWWYGVVGHLESCDGSEYHCRCHNSDTIMLEFNQYTPGSRWRRAAVNRKNHREEGNETDGFYGGIRKLKSKDEINMWKQLWPTDNLE